MIFVAYAAPFAVFREFTAGYFRSSFPFAPPSALYGLLLHIAGIEMRSELGPKTTETRADLPHFRIASAARASHRNRHSFQAETGTVRLPGKGMLFQQLHVIPVGTSSKERKPLTKGNKHHIAPARREILHSYRGVCVVDADAELEARLVGQLERPEAQLSDGQPRYGVPFLGDNNFFLEELAIAQPSEENVDWLVVSSDEQENEDDLLDGLLDWGPQESFPFRLTVWTDRVGMKDTREEMFRVRCGPLHTPPDRAWVTVGPAQAQ